MPPCVIFCVINTWCNGWCTEKRMQKSPVRCYLCLECDGEDSLEHYAVCTHHWFIFEQKLMRKRPHAPIASFFGFCAQTLEEYVFHACHVFAVKRATNIRRHQTGRMSGDCLQELVWNGHRAAALHHQGLAWRYNRKFSSLPAC